MNENKCVVRIYVYTELAQERNTHETGCSVFTYINSDDLVYYCLIPVYTVCYRLYYRKAKAACFTGIHRENRDVRLVNKNVLSFV